MKYVKVSAYTLPESPQIGTSQTCWIDFDDTGTSDSDSDKESSSDTDAEYGPHVPVAVPGEEDYQMPMEWQSINGWKCSYRTRNPEVVNKQQIIDRLKRKRLALPNFQAKEAGPSSSAAAIDRGTVTNENRKLRLKAEREWLAEFRKN